MVNSKEESNLLNEDVKCFLIEEFRHNIKFSEWERKNESQFAFLAATKVEDVINFLRDVYAVKSAAEVIRGYPQKTPERKEGERGFWKLGQTQTKGQKWFWAVGMSECQRFSSRERH